MKRLAMVTATALLASLTVATPAQADTPGCVTKFEYRKVTKGMKMRRVHRIFDTKGVRSGLGDHISRTYKPCSKYGSVWVTYRTGNRRVISKSGTWFG